MTTLREIMSTELVTAGPTATLAQAATLMGRAGVGSALVFEDDVLLAILTERDVVRALTQDFDAPAHPIHHWMTRDPVTADPDTTLEDAITLMQLGGFRHLPVTEGDTVVGIVSIRDLSLFVVRSPLAEPAPAVIPLAEPR